MEVFESIARAKTLVRIRTERTDDAVAREGLVDSAMGAGRLMRSSELLRREMTPALAYVAEGALGLRGTIRLWHVRACELDAALLLGPLAIAPSMQRQGIGSALVGHAIAAARHLGARAIILEGDPSYYSRFGFSVSHASKLLMPGPFARHRLQGLPLVSGGMEQAHGVLTAYQWGSFLTRPNAR